MDYGLPGCTVHGIFLARILKWIAIPFSRGFSWPKDQTQVCCIAGRRFTIWATREDLSSYTCLRNSLRMSACSSFLLHPGYRIKSTVRANGPSWAPKLWGLNMLSCRCLHWWTFQINWFSFLPKKSHNIRHSPNTISLLSATIMKSCWNCFLSGINYTLGLVSLIEITVEIPTSVNLPSWLS